MPYTPTPKQLLYAARADIANITVERDGTGRTTAVFVEVWQPDFNAHVKDAYRSFVFGGRAITLQDGDVYTLDDDPNSWYAYWCAIMVDAVRAGGTNTLHERLNDPAHAHVTWPTIAAEAQARFLAGIDALHAAGAADAPLFDAEVRRYIAANGDAPTLLVQGPPGTGKSYTSAFALFARVQGALAAGIDRRVFLSCKTHAATDVVLAKILELQQQLRRWRGAHPTIFDRFFDARLLDLPLFRVAPREGVPLAWWRSGAKTTAN